MFPLATERKKVPWRRFVLDSKSGPFFMALPAVISKRSIMFYFSSCCSHPFLDILGTSLHFPRVYNHIPSEIHQFPGEKTRRKTNVREKVERNKFLKLTFFTKRDFFSCFSGRWDPPSSSPFYCATTLWPWG